ncbi:cobalamin-binding protein [Candidatus Bathyarchaeota archaeon RBG_13_60_20]|nr:MAG: cobalamin-binding protein [Candidatus Bathyarchaeota archaeon RBG_13_60_20]
MKVLLVEPPKENWFLMGEYLPPPYGLIQLGAYLERELPGVELELLDCNARGIEWGELARRIEESDADAVASSSLATCNTYLTARTLQLAKKADPSVLTVTGGIHFSSLAEESLAKYPEIDAIVRGEGEATFTELVKARAEGKPLSGVAGLTYRDGDAIRVNPDRPLIGDLNTLPLPGYHLVRDTVHMYHFTGMAGRDAPYALIEGSRGCPHRCTFCTQWRHWCGSWRIKTPARIADEMEYIYNEFGARFIWLTDDNFGAGGRGGELAEELQGRDLGDDLMWFTQMRCDDVVAARDSLLSMRRSGLRWVLMGVESPRPSTLEGYRKGIEPSQAVEAVRLLRASDVFTQAMLIVGAREDTRESIAYMRSFAEELDPDFVIYSVLTPFPGTEVYDEAKARGWIVDDNLSNYDMTHAVMGTETLTRSEVQEELYECYRSFYGGWGRRLRGILSRNVLTRRVYMHMAKQDILRQLRDLI